jgi:hypothetical protein
MFTSNATFDVISILYSLIGLAIFWRLVKQWRTFWDDMVTEEDYQLASGIAFFVLVPIGVLLHELGHALATWHVGGEVVDFQWRIFWGYIVPEGRFTLVENWWIALSGNLVSTLLGLVAILLLVVVRKPIVRVLLYLYATMELVYALIFYPLFSFTLLRGDWLMIYDFSVQPYAQITLAAHLLLVVGLWRLERWFSRPPGEPAQEDLAVKDALVLEADVPT